EHDPQSADGALQERGVGNVEGIAVRGEKPGGLVRLRGPLGREVDVGPAGETVLQIPDALPVPEEDQLDHARSLVRRAGATAPAVSETISRTGSRCSARSPDSGLRPFEAGLVAGAVEGHPRFPDADDVERRADVFGGVAGDEDEVGAQAG